MNADQQSHAISSLNDAQQRNLRISCKHIDALLHDIEEVLNPARSNSVFPKYIHDIAPVQRKTIDDYIVRVRAQLLRVLASHAIEVEKPRITASHALHTALTFVEIAIEELSPGRMQGYGPVSETGAADLNGVMRELQSIVQQLHGYVLQRDAPDVRERLKQLERQEGEVELLRRIEEIVTRRGLVEFRTTLLMLLDRLEDTAFEIAIFGRVSSGKSSLLNHVVGTDLLPVGVTPITSVPTRVSYGHEPGMSVWIEGCGARDVDISHLPNYVDERLNRGNEKRVARIAARFPSASLRDGIVLVDTPGLGSLATSGAAETMAYLPRCDVGVVLVDAASTLTPDDLKVIQALSNASIPVTVVLSKADLLNDADRQRVQEYVRDQVFAELAMEVVVCPVSIIPGSRDLLDAWMQGDLAVLYARHQELRRESICRKILALRDSVGAALEVGLHCAAEMGEDRANLQNIDSRLRRSAGALQAVEPELWRMAEQVSGLAPLIIRKAADVAASRWATEPRLDLGGVLWTTAARALTELAGQLRLTLDGTLDSLRLVLLEASVALRVSDPPSMNEISTNREMPVFQLNREQLLVSRPLLAALFGSGALNRRAQKELTALRPSLEQALHSHSRLLRGWSERALSAVEQQFNAYADQYRAQLDRLLTGRQSSGGEVDRLQADLESLAAPLAALVKPGAQTQVSS
jgi:GTP-binding protein EngB required for normal cell division